MVYLFGFSKGFLYFLENFWDLHSSVGKEQPILLSEKVLDGTSCGYQGLDVCANGRCQVRLYKRVSVCTEGGLGDLGAAAQYGGKLCTKIQKMLM